MNHPEQLDLDFQAPATDGYDSWQWGLAEAERRVAAEYGLPLNAEVCVKLWNLDQEFRGRLKLVGRPRSLTRKEPVELRVGNMPFLSSEIERCTVLESGLPIASSGASRTTSYGRGVASARRETSPTGCCEVP